jgi:two-component system sensor histidine kinase DesK
MRVFFLAYALFVFLGPLFSRGGTREWVLAALSIVVFVPIYVATWLAIDRHQDRQALALTVLMALYGFALIPSNIGANTYLIYSAALLPFLVRPPVAIGYLVLLVAGVLLISLVLPPVSRTWLVVPTVLLVLLMGGANVFYAEHHRRDALLWRAREEVQEMATLAERERISRDLHDLLGHTLSVIALKSELASRLAHSDPTRAADEIREVERVSREALSEVRSAVEGYRGRGLSGELHSVARALESSGVRLVASMADTRMPARHESVLALALREAVTNVVRHARAKTCWVSLRDDEDQLVLTVRDDGVGGTPTAGHGMTGMRERVAALGGSVAADGTDGMCLIVTVPKGAPGREIAS